MVEFEGDGVGEGESRCDNFVVLDLSDMWIHAVDDVADEVGGDGLGMGEVAEGVERERDEGGVVSFGLAAEVVEFGVVVGEVFGELVFGEVGFSFHDRVVYSII